MEALKEHNTQLSGHRLSGTLELKIIVIIEYLSIGVHSITVFNGLYINV